MKDDLIARQDGPTGVWHLVHKASKPTGVNAWCGKWVVRAEPPRLGERCPYCYAG